MVKRGISLHSLIPVRAEASEASEQLTQMLFAETCDILSEQPRWTKIRLHTDGQIGWVDFKMLTPLSDHEFETLSQSSSKARVRVPFALAVSPTNGQTFPLTAGTLLPNYHEGEFSILGATLRIDPSSVLEQPLCLDAHNLMEVIRYFLNIPYLWGGKNAFGMDCSGFTQIILSLFGKSLPRNASEQVLQGTPVAELTNAQAGDLVFFDHTDQDPTRTHISHVGIVLDPERVIHCSGRVKVEKLDFNGIFSRETTDSSHPDGQYTHHLAAIRRF